MADTSNSDETENPAEKRQSERNQATLTEAVKQLGKNVAGMKVGDDDESALSKGLTAAAGPFGAAFKDLKDFGDRTGASDMIGRVVGLGRKLDGDKPGSGTEDAKEAKATNEDTKESRKTSKRRAKKDDNAADVAEEAAQTTGRVADTVTDIHSQLIDGQEGIRSEVDLGDSAIVGLLDEAERNAERRNRRLIDAINGIESGKDGGGKKKAKGGGKDDAGGEGGKKRGKKSGRKSGTKNARHGGGVSDTESDSGFDLTDLLPDGGDSGNSEQKSKNGKSDKKGKRGKRGKSGKGGMAEAFRKGKGGKIAGIMAGAGALLSAVGLGSVGDAVAAIVPSFDTGNQAVDAMGDAASEKAIEKASEKATEKVASRAAGSAGGKAAAVMGEKATAEVAAKAGAAVAGKGVAATAARALGPVVAIGMAGFDAMEGWNDAEMQRRAFGLKEGEEANTSQKTGAAVANMLDMGGLATGAARLLGFDVSTEDLAKELGGGIGERVADAMEKWEEESQKNGVGNTILSVMGVGGGGGATLAPIPDLYGETRDERRERVKSEDAAEIKAAGPKPEEATKDAVKLSESQFAGELGGLSERYESGGKGAGIVSTGKGDAGGVSYGTYQMMSKGGEKSTVAKFARNSQWAGEFEGLAPGSEQFSDKWREVAKRDPKAFRAAQHDYIKKSHYDPAAERIAGLGLDVNSRSKALQDVIWSTSVQHGAGGSKGVVDAALKKTWKSAKDVTDEELIQAIYDERGRVREDGQLAHFSRNSENVQAGVAKRFKDEKQRAIAMLEAERKAGQSGQEAVAIASAPKAGESAKAPEPVMIAEAKPVPAVEPQAILPQQVEPQAAQAPQNAPGSTKGGGGNATQAGGNQGLEKQLARLTAALETQNKQKQERPDQAPDKGKEINIPSGFDDTYLNLRAADVV